MIFVLFKINLQRWALPSNWLIAILRKKGFSRHILPPSSLRYSSSSLFFDSYGPKKKANNFKSNIMEKVLEFQRKQLWKMFKAEMEEYYGGTWWKLWTTKQLQIQWEEFVRHIAHWS